MNTAIIDLGTNSLRLFIYSLKDKKNPALLLKKRFIIRLGRGMYDDMKLSSAAVERAFEALDVFCSLLNEYKVSKVKAVATSAVREASNSKQFLEEVKEKFNLDFEVISGAKEGEYIGRGFVFRYKNTLPPFSIVLDIGGGSVEVIYLTKDTIKEIKSLPLGAARIQEKFLKSYPPLKENFNQACSHIQKVIKEELALNFPQAPLFGTSGSIRSLGRIAKALNFVESKNHLGDDVPKLFLEHFVKKHSTSTLQTLKNIPALEPQRAEVILSAVLVLLKLLNHFKQSKATAVKSSLQDGILEEILTEK